MELVIEYKNEHNKQNFDYGFYTHDAYSIYNLMTSTIYYH